VLAGAALYVGVLAATGEIREELSAVRRLIQRRREP
jgi:hypothetical protein